MTKNLISSASLEQDNLIAGGIMPIVTDIVTLKSGAAYLRGSVLAVITATSLAVKVDSTKSDGSQVAYAILAEDTDATSVNTPAVVYMTGEFNAAKLIFGGTDTITIHKKALRALSLFAKTLQG
ncbi:head decoration protein [Paenibacillus psychroresistens]|uniref:Head decoration protein n=1 Tax=Paenibacillus psychroresistens TaxID=1778678 RepID=A0A6B8RKH7_9BACL|nr:head decoration protein [Paenibacillus psychroresistens]QGQ95858.1 head decoration protein [Paenibacillus psychroresistens]